MGDAQRARPRIATYLRPSESVKRRNNSDPDRRGMSWTDPEPSGNTVSPRVRSVIGQHPTLCLGRAQRTAVRASYSPPRTGKLRHPPRRPQVTISLVMRRIGLLARPRPLRFAEHVRSALALGPSAWRRRGRWRSLWSLSRLPPRGPSRRRTAITPASSIPSRSASAWRTGRSPTSSPTSKPPPALASREFDEIDVRVPVRQDPERALLRFEDAPL